MAVTGFSGTIIPGIEEGLPPGVDAVDETFIDTTRATLRVFDVSALGGSAAGQLVYTPQPFEVLASQIGQVFAAGLRRRRARRHAVGRAQSLRRRDVAAWHPHRHA